MPGRGRVPRPAHDTSTPKRICRPRALGLTPIHKRATLHTSLLNKLVTTASPSCADKPDNITDDVYGLSDVDFEESLSLSGLEHLSDSQSIFPLNASFVSARSLLETNLPEVSPETSNDQNSPENHDGLENRNFDNINLDNIENECKDLSDDMFQSRLEMSIRNHESQFCKTTQYRREVERLFEKVEMSILDSSCVRQNAEVSVTSTMFENDVFVEDVKENQFVNNQLSSCIRTSNNFRQDKSDFYGLPELAKSLFGIYKNVDKLYEWQNECLCLDAITKRKNLIYALPTSGGKTLVAEILMLKEILGRKKNVLFVLPFVALVQEKVWGLSPFALQLEFLIEEYAAGKGNFPPKKRRNKNSIYVATLEKGLGLVRNLIELNRLNEIGLIVVDELHLLGEPSRGSTLEMLLASVMFIPNDIQIIGMSATIGNIDELAKFLNAEIYSNQFRPVELKEYVKVGHEISLISWTEGGMDLNTHRRVDYTYSAQVEKIDPDHLGGLVMEVIPKGSCLIFCPTKKNCENVAVLLCKVIFRQLLEYRAKEKQSLLRALKEEAGSECSILAGAVPWGVAYHHSGLTAEERRLLEDSFRAGVINVLCCTSTLAAGVNLPATRVILRSPHVGREFISLSTYKQMAGRAGRAGYGCVGESIIICPPERYGQLRELLNQPMDKATSNLHGNDGTPLRGFVLSAIGLNMVANREQILNLLQTTLMAVQADRLGLCLKTLTNTTLKNLIESGAVEVIQPGLEPSAPLTKHGSSMSHSNEHVDGGSNQKLVVYTNSIFKVSKLGKAAIKGCMDLKVAYQLYEDMKLAQKDLVVMGELHLLYLVTPYEYTDIQPNMVVYYSIYSSLDSEGLQTAQVLGITESSAVRMVTGKSITNVPERVLSRFYVTLMLHELWRQVPVAEVAEKYHVSRGTVQSMMMSTAAFASNVLRFCEELEEFWAFQDLLVNFTKRISHCCAPELLPLMELPSVKKARAIQLYKAGYKRIEDIAKANASDLVESIQHLSNKVATQLISSAKLMLIEKVENLREEAEDVMDGIGAISIY